MVTSRHLNPLKGNDKKALLHNDLIKDLQKQNLLSGHISQDEGHRLIKCLSNALWYLDGRSETINQTSRKRKNVTMIPER